VWPRTCEAGRSQPPTAERRRLRRSSAGRNAASVRDQGTAGSWCSWPGCPERAVQEFHRFSGSAAGGPRCRRARSRRAPRSRGVLAAGALACAVLADGKPSATRACSATRAPTPTPSTVSASPPAQAARLVHIADPLPVHHPGQDRTQRLFGGTIARREPGQVLSRRRLSSYARLRARPSSRSRRRPVVLGSGQCLRRPGHEHRYQRSPGSWSTVSPIRVGGRVHWPPAVRVRPGSAAQDQGASAARTTVSAAPAPCSATRRPRKDGAGSSSGRRRGAWRRGRWP
jgi:hypothetical protein